MNGKTLKIIAVVTMVLDHIGAAVIATGLYATGLSKQIDYNTQETILLIYRILRKIGRISFPIFCFLLVEGFLHTGNKRKYALRLLVFALVSEIPFDLASDMKIWSFDTQNVMFTLLLGFLAMWGMEFVKERLDDYAEERGRTVFPAAYGLELIPAGICAAAAWLLHTDYGWKGVLCITVLYLTRRERVLQCVAGAIAFLWEIPAPVAFLPVYFYNGQRGKQSKYFFYVFYPGHLLLLWLISAYVLPGLIHA